MTPAEMAGFFSCVHGGEEMNDEPSVIRMLPERIDAKISKVLMSMYAPNEQA